MKTYEGVEVQLHVFLTSVTDGEELSASHPGTLPRGKNPSIHWTEGWMGPRADPESVAKRKKSLPCRESDPGRPTHSLVTILTQLSRR